MSLEKIFEIIASGKKQVGEIKERTKRSVTSEARNIALYEIINEINRNEGFSEHEYAFDRQKSNRIEINLGRSGLKVSVSTGLVEVTSDFYHGDVMTFTGAEANEYYQSLLKKIEEYEGANPLPF